MVRTLCFHCGAQVRSLVREDPTSCTVWPKNKQNTSWDYTSAVCCYCGTLNCVPLFATSWTAGGQVFLSFTISWSLLKLMSIESVVPSTRLILCHPIVLLPSVLPSIRVFSNEWALSIRWPKYWSFTFSISPSSEYSGLISFRIDWFDLLAIQGTLKSLFQHHNSRAPILWCLLYCI